MRLHASIFLAALLTAGCGNGATPSTHANASNDAGVSATASAASGAGSKPAAKSTFAGRSGEVVNPDDVTMVLLYHDLAGIAPPIDTWVDEDNRVQFAPPPDKAAKRAAVRAEFESAAAGVRDIGTIRLSMNANLSDYDPTYGEFTIRALSPSSEIPFTALRQKIALRFANGRDAQVWQVSQAQAQTIRDKLGYGSASLDVSLRITGVQPAPGGGTLVTDVVEYELRESRRGSVLGRVQVAH